MFDFRFHKEVNSLANKENTIKCRNQLFVSDSDSSEKEENDEFAHEKTECKKSNFHFIYFEDIF